MSMYRCCAKPGKAGERELNRYFFCTFLVYISPWKTMWKMCKTLKIKLFAGCDLFMRNRKKGTF